MEKFFLFDNFLVTPQILFDSEKYKKVLDDLVSKGRLKGVQLTHYWDPPRIPEPRITIGGWLSDPNDDKLLEDVKAAITKVGGSEIINQNRESVFNLYSPQGFANIIACFA